MRALETFKSPYNYCIYMVTSEKNSPKLNYLAVEGFNPDLHWTLTMLHMWFQCVLHPAVQLAFKSRSLGT